MRPAAMPSRRPGGATESTFNPARANPKAMRQHMAKKYWRNLPETEAIPEMLRTAPSARRK